MFAYRIESNELVATPASRRSSAVTEASDMMTASGASPSQSPVSNYLDATARAHSPFPSMGDLDATVGSQSTTSHDHHHHHHHHHGDHHHITEVYVTPEGEEVERRWCNFLYTTKCPFSVNHNAGTMEPCRFMHLDVFVRLPAEERKAAAMPNLMTRHMKGLAKELHKVVTARAAREVSTWLVQRAWYGADGALAAEELNPYADFAETLRKLGWVIEEQHNTAGATCVEDMPYAKTIASIIGVAVSSLHYGLGKCADIMFNTLAAVFKLDTPSIKCPEPELDDEDIMAGFFEGAGGSFDAPALTIDTVSEVPSSAQDVCPSSPSSSAGKTPKQKKKAKALTGLLLSALPQKPVKDVKAAASPAARSPPPSPPTPPASVDVPAVEAAVAPPTLATLQAYSALQLQQMHVLQQQVALMQQTMMAGAQGHRLC
eukprot:TRINITY_DN484_c1_g1_i1.p1 TRINITY_DN484_c1_g1~~TRINITY_DN484_c1_g1_i1.p1  ORF type:complete len:430 (+),score=165.28 TRINITY_DN484_c1_g1_i1:64-1353(+)